MSFRSLAMVVGTAALSACGYPSYGFLVYDDAATDTLADDTQTTTDAPPNDSAIDSAADTKPPTDTGSDATSPCPILTGGDVCTSIPKLTAPSQTLDGVGDEFCDVKATKLVANAGAYMAPNPPPSGVDTTVLIRVAWSSIGLHVHVHVDQASVYPPGVSEPTWYGDGIELFAAGYDTLTGFYDGTTHDPGAMQIIGDPPDPSRGLDARAELWQSNVVGAYSKYAARVVPGGYEEEFELPWTDLHATSPGSGTGIGFDLGVDVRQSASVASPPLLQSFVYFAPDPSPVLCASTRPTGHPSCDDKNWCKPKLE